MSHCTHNGTSGVCPACQPVNLSKDAIDVAINAGIDVSKLNLNGNTLEYTITSSGTGTLGPGYVTTSVPLVAGQGLYPTISNGQLHTVKPQVLDMTCPHCFAYGAISVQGNHYYDNPGGLVQTRVKCGGCSATWFVPSTNLPPILQEGEFNLDNAESAEDWADQHLIKQLIRALGKDPGLRAQLRDALNSTKWYDCAKCEGGYEDQECTCK